MDPSSNSLHVSARRKVRGAAQLPRRVTCVTRAGRSAGGAQSLPASPPGSSGQRWGRRGAAGLQLSGFSLPRLRGEVSDFQAQSGQRSAPGIAQPHAVLIWAGLQGFEPVRGLFFPFNKFILVRHFFSPVRKNPPNIFRVVKLFVINRMPNEIWPFSEHESFTTLFQ